MIVFRLNSLQRKVLADVGIAAGQLSAASMVLPFLVPGLDVTRLPVVILGLFTTCICWTLSVLIVKNIKP